MCKCIIADRTYRNSLFCQCDEKLDHCHHNVDNCVTTNLNTSSLIQRAM